MRLRAGAPFVAGLALSTLARPAAATEREWHVGVSGGYSSLIFRHGRDENGGGGMLHARYGMTDAFDLTMNAGLFAYEDVHQTRLAPHTNVGVSYVIDISTWIPWVGFTTGVVDIITLSCTDVGTVCGHHLRPALGLAGGMEYRVPAKGLELPLGIRFEYQFLLPDEPWSALFFTAYAAVIP